MARSPGPSDGAWGWVILICVGAAIYDSLVQALILLMSVAIILFGIYLAGILVIWLWERWQRRRRHTPRQDPPSLPPPQERRKP
jgi:hypothetical protein